MPATRDNSPDLTDRSPNISATDGYLGEPLGDSTQLMLADSTVAGYQGTVEILDLESMPGELRDALGLGTCRTNGRRGGVDGPRKAVCTLHTHCQPVVQIAGKWRKNGLPLLWLNVYY